MIKNYTLAIDVLLEIEDFIRAHIGDLDVAMDEQQDTNFYDYQAGQLQAYNTVLNLLTACYKLKAVE